MRGSKGLDAIGWTFVDVNSPRRARFPEYDLLGLMNIHSISWRQRQVLFWLLIANVISTIFHYADNVCYFHLYPEPPWLNAKIVDLFWFVMTPLAVTGYWLLRRGFFHRGCLFLYAYAAASLLVLGHYLLAPFFSISLRIHCFILLEATLACALIFQLAWIQVRRASP